MDASLGQAVVGADAGAAARNLEVQDCHPQISSSKVPDRPMTNPAISLLRNLVRKTKQLPRFGLTPRNTLVLCDATEHSCVLIQLCASVLQAADTAELYRAPARDGEPSYSADTGEEQK